MNKSCRIRLRFCNRDKNRKDQFDYYLKLIHSSIDSTWFDDITHSVKC